MADRGPSSRASTRWVEAALGLLLVGGFLWFSALAVPHLTNNAIGDLEFSGWSGAVAGELARGRVPYRDFVLPIPPGSLVLLAAARKLSGRLWLLDELRLIAACQLGMGLMAHALARRFTSRVNAWLVAFASLVMLLRGPKECAYDHTAELVAWASITLGAFALTGSSKRWCDVAWVAAGACATFTFAFKQSTGMGVVLGWIVALGYLAVLRFLRERSLSRLARPVTAWLAGGVLGLSALAVLLWSLGSTLGEYYQAVLVDGAPLKGGKLPLSVNLANYLLGSPAYPSALLFTALAALVIVRIGSKAKPWSWVSSSETNMSVRTAMVVALPVVLVFGAAIALVMRGTVALPDAVLYFGDRLRFVPGFGLLFACLFFVAWLSGTDDDEGLAIREALGALLLVALGTSLLHNLSSPEFRPFYDPNPLIPFAFLFLFVALDRAEQGRTKLVVYTLSIAALFSPKLDRTLMARLPAGREGYWGGLYVNPDAVPLARAAERARELAGARGTVLVLPEDLELRALIDRPRPALRGAVVFVDQYSARLVDEDLGTLERDLPRVVVIRPAERDVWLRLFALWTSTSGARRITERFVDDWLPKHYVKDSTFPTRFDVSTVTLEIWVRAE